MCRPPQEKFNWQEELPPHLVAPQGETIAMPLLEMVPFVDVQNIGAMSDESDADSDVSMAGQYDDTTFGESDEEKTEAVSDMSSEPNGESAEPVVISSCLNDPKVVWPSDTESSSVTDSEEEEDNDTNVDSVTIVNNCASCGTSVPLEGNSVHNCPGGSSGLSRGVRGRNFARRSRPFFGKYMLLL